MNNSIKDQNKICLISNTSWYLYNFRFSLINELIENYSQMIYQYVMNDPKKIYSFQEFIDEVQSIKDFFSSRFDFLINNDEISQQGCIIDNVSYYVSDSDGDTIIYNEKEKSKSYTIKERVSPKQGRVVLFDGALFHTDEEPKEGRRCIVRYDLVDLSVDSHI